MDSILVKGGNPLKGEIKINGAKNASLPILASVLLTAGEVILHRVPNLSDIDTMLELLRYHGVKIEVDKANAHSPILKLCADNIKEYTAPYDIVSKMRASIWVLGPLISRFGQAMVSLPGGCAIGVRQVDLHIDVIRALGAQVDIKNGYIYAIAPNGLKGCEFHFAKVSVGATINGILAAVLAKGVSVFYSCALEPEIVDLCNFLNSIGADIQGIGTSTLHIKGVAELGGGSHFVVSDRIEAGTYMLAAAATGGRVLIQDIEYSLVENLADQMRLAGSNITVCADGLEVSHEGIIKPVNIATAPYPGFATDLQAQFTAFMLKAGGRCQITENIYENRFMHVPELCRMGADITVDGHVATINGVQDLTGAEVMASDLRASVSLIIAGLCAQGATKVRRVYHLDRGYQKLEQTLRLCGAEIERIHDDKL